MCVLNIEKKEMLDAAGKETIYKCANKVYVNGVRYSAKEVLNGALPVGVHTQFIVNDIGKIYIIVFDETAEIYEKVSYNAKTKSFTGVMLESGIPVYYQGGVSPAYLDENHLYNLEVYDYGINITDYHAKNNKETIWDIDFSSGFDADFKQHIDVFCNTAADSFLVGQLYSGENQLVQEQTGTDGEGLIFSDLPNETAEYTIKLWLEDAEGNMLSYVYILPYKTEKSTVFYAQAAVSAISNGAFGEDVLQIKMFMPVHIGFVLPCRALMRLLLAITV
ncbi:MAG: hypothetical protein IJ952_02845 [Alistipes sp.]|nr:hypothetical protein [Alistipes sp.]